MKTAEYQEEFGLLILDTKLGSKEKQWKYILVVNSILSLSFCRYYYLAFKAHETPLGSRENCLAILEKSKLDNWILGKTKVEGASSFSRMVYSYKSCVIVVQKLLHE